MHLSEEQKLLRDSIARFMADHYDPMARRRIIATPAGYLREHWRRFAELGWLAAPFNEADGGLGGSLMDVMIIMEGLGRGLFAGPYVGCVVLAGGVVSLCADEPTKARVLAPLMAGERICSLAYAEPQARHDIADVRTSATRRGSSFTLNGAKTLVMFGASADTLIVSARSSGGQREEEGISLFLVPAHADGVHLRDYATVDGHRAAELRLDDVCVDADALLGEPGEAHAAMEETIECATLALCAEAVGCMASLEDLTLVHLKQREQFGQVIGHFQALQHRMVDMHISCELARAVARAAAAAIDYGLDPNERKRWVSAAKVQAGMAGREVGQEAIQLHGGMGMTDELAVGHYFKRLTAIATLFGDTTHHLRRFSALDSVATIVGEDLPAHPTR